FIVVDRHCFSYSRISHSSNRLRRPILMQGIGPPGAANCLALLRLMFNRSAKSVGVMVVMATSHQKPASGAGKFQSSAVLASTARIPSVTSPPAGLGRRHIHRATLAHPGWPYLQRCSRIVPSAGLLVGRFASCAQQHLENRLLV